MCERLRTKVFPERETDFGLSSVFWEPGTANWEPILVTKAYRNCTLVPSRKASAHEKLEEQVAKSQGFKVARFRSFEGSERSDAFGGREITPDTLKL
jgi:hypothetical protein